MSAIGITDFGCNVVWVVDPPLFLHEKTRMCFGLEIKFVSPQKPAQRPQALIPAWRPRGLSKSVIHRVINGGTPFTVRTTLL